MAIARSYENNRFLLYMVLASALLIFVGFSPSFYLKSILHAPPPLSALTTVHGVVFTAWVLLFVFQSALIGFGNPALHRQLGVLGAVLFGAVLTIGLSTAITAGRLGHAPPGAPVPLAFMALPVIDIIGTALLFMLALANRSRPEFHKRLMLASLVSMTSPGTARILFAVGQFAAAIWISIVVMDLLLVVAIIYDLVVRKRVHPAYLWSGAVFLLINAGVAWGFSSHEWLAFAAWLTRGG